MPAGVYQQLFLFIRLSRAPDSFWASAVLRQARVKSARLSPLPLFLISLETLPQLERINGKIPKSKGQNSLYQCFLVLMSKLSGSSFACVLLPFFYFFFCLISSSSPPSEMSQRSTVDLYFLFEEKIKIRGFPDFTLIMLFASYWSALHFQNQLATIFHTHADWNVFFF